MGTLGSAEFSQMAKSIGQCETPDFHWPPMIGVLTTFGTVAVPGPKFGFLLQSRLPTGVSTVSVFIASEIFCFSLGLPLAFSTVTSTSQSARLHPCYCF